MVKPVKLNDIKNSWKVDKRYIATFLMSNGNEKTVHFG